MPEAHNQLKVLFVEGEVDKYFIESLLKKFNLRLGVKVEPKGGISNLQVTLKDSEFIGRLQDGTIKHFGIVADADSPLQNDAGFQKRRDSIMGDLSAITQGPNRLVDLTTPSESNPNEQGGEVYTNANGSVTIGLWLVPNHQEDGCLEDFILKTVNWDKPLIKNGQTVLINQQPVTQDNLKTYADSCWNALDGRSLKLFQPYDEAKASAYTWLAWQRKPTQFLSSLVDKEQINMDHPDVQAFKDWFQRCFSLDENS